MDIGKLILVLGGGYLAYEYFLAPAAAVAPAAPGGIQPGPTPTSVKSAPPIVNAANTYALLLAATQKDNFNRGTVDQFDYYYGLPSVRGIPAPDPVSDWGLTDVTRNEQMTLDEYWKLASAHGLSGLRGGYVRAALSDYEPTNRLWVLENE